MKHPKFHRLSAEEAMAILKTSPQGLSRSEAEKRLKKYGFNELPREVKIGRLRIFLSQFNSVLIYILIFAGLASIVLGDWVDASIILAAILINTLIGYIQENKANNALERLKQLVEHKAVVLRDKHKTEIDSRLLTVGDIIFIRAGNRVPADARLIEAVNLQINEASLTGESLPATKHTKPLTKATSLADRENMIYAGTVVVRGTGKAVVCAVGQNTEIGRIASLVAKTQEETTPLQKRLSQFSVQLGIVLGGLSALVMIIGLLQGREWFEMFLTAIALAVAAVPEGLTVAVTVILTVGMQQILKHRALVRKLIAAETLGSTTVICSDKTGTLTEGKMHVAHIVIGEHEFEIEAPGSRQISHEAKLVSLALQAAMMCNDAVIENPEDELDEWRIIGEPTDAALMSAAVQSGLDKNKILQQEKLVAELPFDSALKYMIALYQRKEGGFVLYEKGAPEQLLQKSSHFFHQGKLASLTAEEKSKLSRTYQKLTSRGLRVIGVAYRKINQLNNPENPDWEALDQNLAFIGFIALKDPLRREARSTIQICIKAGIRPIIITGDHKLTAATIAREVGIKVDKNTILTGEDLDKIHDEKLKNLVGRVNVYARVSPHHKLRIVKMLQERGEVVAMTGDGINDSPALKAADIGISLGTATDIAKETSDLVLLDNNFKTIVGAVRQGRIIFNNIRKVVTFLLSDSFSQVILVSASLLIPGMPLALLPAQILWMNIIQDGLPGFAISMEEEDYGVMQEKPIKRNEPILNREMKIIIFAVGLFRDLMILGIVYYLFKSSYSAEFLQTFAFAALSTNSLLNIFSLRSLLRPIWKINLWSNHFMLWAVGVSMAFLLIGIYVPFFQGVLSAAPLPWEMWGIILLSCLITIALIEFTKYLFVNRVKLGK
ncbi:HAD family hydrolase [Candidatus Parcubacteria bacterium]|nr:MAG: HAD family hydrolase [Candidatus Parcubacteria bacterium]